MHGKNGPAESEMCSHSGPQLRAGRSSGPTQADNAGQGLRYGDKVYLENVRYSGQRLTHDSRPFQSEWITTKAGGDYWVVEPGVPA